MTLARDIIDEISLTDLCDTEEELKALVAEAPAKLEGLNQKYEEIALKKEVDQANRDVKSHLNAANDALGRSNFEKCVKSLSDARDALEKLSPLRHLDDAKNTYEDFTKQIEDISSNYDAAVAKRDAEEAIRKCKSAWKECNDEFEHSRWEMCLKAIQKAEGLRCDLTDEKYQDQACVKEFLGDLTPEKFAEVKKKFSDKMRAREFDELKRKTTSALSMATQHLEHHRMQSALEASSTAADCILEIQSNWTDLGAEFATECEGKLKAFKETYAKNELDKRLSAAKRSVESNLKECEDAFSHHRIQEALQKLNQAKEAASDVVSDELFKGLDDVESFYTEVKGRIEKLQTDIEAKMRELSKRHRESHVPNAVRHRDTWSTRDGSCAAKPLSSAETPSKRSRTRQCPRSFPSSWLPWNKAWWRSTTRWKSIARREPSRAL